MAGHSEGTNLIESVFAGRSETAARMRALDWSTTALGSVEQWPQSLRTIVRFVLASGYPMCICWGPDFVLLYNDAYLPVLGPMHPRALGLRARELDPVWESSVKSHWERVVQEQKSIFLADLLVPVNRNFFEETYFTVSLSPIPDDNGNVGGVLSIAVETTERVIEDRRRHLLRGLASRTAGTRNQEEVWRVSTETLGENCASLPFAFLYTYRSSDHQAHLAGASMATAEALRPPVIDCHSENLWRLDPALTRDGVVIELGDRASGVPVPNWPDYPKEASVVPIRLGEHGETLGFLVAGLHPGRAFDDAYRQFVYRIIEQITIGLTSARAFEHERRRAETLAELDRAKTTFFSNVSHEFRTPLTLMLGPLEEELQLEARQRLDPERHERLTTVHRNTLRVLKLVNTLLDFSRIEAGRMQATYQPTDLAGFTTEIASAFDSAMQNAGLRYSVECHSIAEPLYVDRDMWEKIVLNLLSNAYRFTFEGEVALTLKPVDGAVQLQVGDTGVGIPEEHREQVFERFHRVESTRARTYEGTGIGLALVQELVKLHGGTVRVESAVGAGSTFTVSIPRGKKHLPAERIQAAPSLVSTTIRAEAYAEEARRWSGNESGVAGDVTAVPKLVSPTRLPQSRPDGKCEPVVVADDNADMRQYLTRLLSARYEVHAVADGRQALEVTRQLHPALVLADVMMPRLDGFGLLRAVREDSAIADTPVILVSARAGEESRVEGLEADADDYLIKPFAARELLARVAAHIKMANVRRETAEREERLRSEGEFEREKLRASEERLAETSRLYRELQLADAELQLQVAILQQLPVAAWTLKPDGTPDFVNRVWLDFAEQTLDFVRSHPEAWMTAVHPEDRERAAKSFREGVQSGRGFAFETRSLRAKDGTYRWHLQQAVVLRDSEGKVTRFVGATTDVDEQKRTEDALRQAQDDLARISRAATLGELTASLAHELNQPITGAITNANVCLRKLERDEVDLEGVRAAVTRIARDAQRAADIIGRTRSQFERGALKRELVDVNEINRETVALLRDEAMRYNIAVRTELADDLPPIVGDRVQLQQVAMNLIVNGIEAMKGIDGMREMVIRSQRAEAEQIQVSVSDTGIGFAPELAERIFEPFFTTKPHGTGMGLRICRSIVESHGGRLWAVGAPGRGATFHLSLPVARAVRHNSTHSESPRTGSASGRRKQARDLSDRQL